MKNILGRKTGYIILILQNKNLESDIQLTNTDRIERPPVSWRPTRYRKKTVLIALCNRLSVLIGGFSATKEKKENCQSIA